MKVITYTVFGNGTLLGVHENDSVTTTPNVPFTSECNQEMIDVFWKRFKKGKIPKRPSYEDSKAIAKIAFLGNEMFLHAPDIEEAKMDVSHHENVVVHAFVVFFCEKKSCHTNLMYAVSKKTEVLCDEEVETYIGEARRLFVRSVQDR